MKNFKEFKMNEGKDEFAPDKTLKNQYCYYCEYHLKKKTSMRNVTMYCTKQPNEYTSTNYEVIELDRRACQYFEKIKK